MEKMVIKRSEQPSWSMVDEKIAAARVFGRFLFHELREQR
jgi:hypothetical protein